MAAWGAEQIVGLLRGETVNHQGDLYRVTAPLHVPGAPSVSLLVAALDALTRRQMQEELLQLWEDTRFTVLFVTHSIEEAVIIGSRILIMSPHPGQVKAELNAHHLGHTNVGDDDFAALQDRIHTMIFADQVLEDEVENHG